MSEFWKFEENGYRIRSFSTVNGAYGSIDISL